MKYYNKGKCLDCSKPVRSGSTVRCRDCSSTYLRANPEKTARWKGGRYLARDGYVRVWTTEDQGRTCGCYILEHRLVMQKSLGRLLNSAEHVHHINGVKSDNRIENLVLTTNEAHKKLHRLIQSDFCLPCKSNGKIKKAKARALCPFHYRQWREQEFLAGRIADGVKCSKCEKLACARKLCRSHYNSIFRYDTKKS